MIRDVSNSSYSLQKLFAEYGETTSDIIIATLLHEKFS